MGAIPHAYVMATRDNVVRITLQHRLVKEIDAVSARPTVVTELDSSHSPFLSQPSALAEFIPRWNWTAEGVPALAPVVTHVMGHEETFDAIEELAANVPGHR
jgi:hypothetical protein